MRKHLLYLSYVIRHKYYVFVACRKYGVGILQALAHDLSKFRPVEWMPYTNWFYGNFPDPDDKKEAKRLFKMAWEIHWRRNKHHWNHYVLEYDECKTPVTADGRWNDNPDDWKTVTKVKEMPEKYVREMVSDWCGAGQALGKPDVKAWYRNNKDKMVLHPATRVLVEDLIQYQD